MSPETAPDPTADPAPAAPDGPAPTAPPLGPAAYLGEEVVLDTATPLIYLGTLVGWGPDYLLLRDADAHDTRNGTTSKERYALEARKFGIRKNRDEILVRTAVVASLSRLSDVTLY